MLPILQIGPLAVPIPGLLIILSIWVGISLAEKMAPQFCIEKVIIYNSIGLGIMIGLIGARVSFVVLHFDSFLTDLRAAFSLNYQLLDFWGGIVTTSLVILIYGYRKGVNWYQYFDALTPMFAVFLVAYPLAELASGRSYGIPTDLPWAISLWGFDRHPTQIYDFLASLGIFVWLILSSRRLPHRKIGYTFILFVVLTSLSRVILDGFQEDSGIIFGQLRNTQVIAWSILAVALLALFIIDRKHTISLADTTS